MCAVCCVLCNSVCSFSPEGHQSVYSWHGHDHAAVCVEVYLRRIHFVINPRAEAIRFSKVVVLKQSQFSGGVLNAEQ